MAFLAPIIIGAIGLTGVAATIGTALIGTAIALGVGYAAQSLMGKPATPGVGLAGTQLSLDMDPNASRKIPVGITASAGNLQYWQLSGADNEILELVVSLGDWPCEELVGLFVNGKRVTLNANGTVDEFPGVMKITFHNGDFSQVADAELVANSNGHWTSNDRGAGVCYVKVWMKDDKELYPGGRPRLLFELKGAKFYDWRKDDTAGGVGSHRWSDVSTWEYSNNPAVVAYNWRRGFWHGSNHFTGMQTPSSALNLDSYTTAANICDEDVALKAGGTEKRYRISGFLDDSATRRDVLQEILKVFGGEEIESGGFYTLYAGAARAIVMVLTDDDLMAEADFTYTGTKSGDQLVNAVFGAYRDPESGYQEAALPPRIGAGEVALDGQRHDVRFNYEMASSQTQCQRLMEQSRREARFQGVLETTFRARCSVLQPGDWVTLSVTSRGWDNRLFQIVDGTTLPDQQAPLVLAETASTVFDWVSSMELDKDDPGQIVTGGPVITQLSGLSVTNIMVTQQGGSARRPGLQVNWTPVTDLTVDAVRFEYRIKDSGGVALERRAENPVSGQYSWVDGIQGRVRYEVRALLVSTPARSMTWTPWISTLADTEPQVVDLGATVIEVAPGSVGHTELSAQAAFEIELATKIEGILGPAFNIQSEDGILAMLQDYQGWEDHKRESASLVAETNTARAEIKTERDVRAGQNAAIATQMETVQTTVGEVSSSVQVVQQSVDGISSSYSVIVNQNGQWIGAIKLDGTGGLSTIDMVADIFRVSAIEGGQAVPIFVIDGTGENAVASLNVEQLLIPGTITAEHLEATIMNVLQANITELVAVLLRNQDSSQYWDMETGEFVIGAVP